MIINNETFNILNTMKFPNGQHAHIVNMKDSILHEGDLVSLEVDEAFRADTAANHSATHLLNEALRMVLGKHVIQQGSQVTNEGLRFDFNNYENLTSDQIIEIEQIVNRAIKDSNIVTTTITTIDQAKALGAQAVFGEKYGSAVRLVEMAYSKELCGGTHVKNTSEIEKFAILGVESKGSGIFRIEAATKNNIITAEKEKLNSIIEDLKNLEEKRKAIMDKAADEKINLVSNPIILPRLTGSYQDILNYREVLTQTRNVIKDLDKEFDNIYRAHKSSDYASLLNDKYQVNGTDVVIAKVVDYEIDVVKDIIDKISATMSNCVVFIASVNHEKIVFIAKSKGNSNRCGDLVKAAAIITGGNGGGRPDFAQAGGKDVNKIDEALAKVKEMIK